MIEFSDEDVYMENENKKPVSISGKKALPKGTTKKSAASGEKSVEEIYQKKTQLEHILLRPDTYIGSVEHINQAMWVFDPIGDRMIQKTISFVPGFFKIFDEILVNAADNKVRDSSMDTIKVDIDRIKGTISIYNNGRGIPVVVHAKEGIYVPELIFGHLLTSSNYDDNTKKITGGRNGYGAKLCNIFSSEFTVETADGEVGKKFKQSFSSNMSVKSNPIISDWSKEDYTKITFKPDLAKFGMAEFDEDIVSLFHKRVIDLAGCLKDVKVFYNGERIKIKSFKQYVELYLKNPAQNNNPAGEAEKEDGSSTPLNNGSSVEIIHQQINDRWEVCVAASDGQFQQVSFVNSINTYKGGTHVNHVVDQIVSHLVESATRKNKSLQLKPFQVKNHLFVFIQCNIENPAFDSQTKENLTLKESQFGSKCPIPEEFVKKIINKSPILDNVLQWAKFKQDQQLKKTDGAKKNRISGIAKLDDANMAGTKQASKCTLILTEGDSAKALAVSGLSVIGRDYWGVFPLRGKLLNVREATHKQIMENVEINALKQILGLQHNKAYTSVDSLRYGRLMIMTDQVEPILISFRIMMEAISKV
jgi:DNA topoisomerase II